MAAYDNIDHLPEEVRSFAWRFRWAGALARLERSRSVEDLLRLLIAIDDWLKEERPPSHRQIFITKLFEDFLPALKKDLPQTGDLPEIEIEPLLAQRVEEWAHEWKRKRYEEEAKKG